MAKTPKSTDKTSNTLFNYFNKTPVEKTSVVKDVKPDKSGGLSQDKSARKLDFPQSETKYKAGDVVWAKMEGHPWWPALVCNHPKEGKIWRRKGGLLVHVQFVESPPSRGWIKEKFLKAFTGSEGSGCGKGGMFHSGQAKWREAVREADAMLTLSLEGRLEKVIVVESSHDEEEEEEEGEKCMVVDDDDGGGGGGLAGDSSNEKENKRPSVATNGRKRRRIIESDEEDVHNSSLDESFQPDEKASGSDDDDDEEEEEEEEDEEDDNDDDEGSKTNLKGLKRRRRNEKSSKSLEKLQQEREAKRMKKDDEENGDGDDDVTEGTDAHKVALSAKKRLSSFSAANTPRSKAPSPTTPKPPKTPKTPSSQAPKTPSSQAPKSLSTPLPTVSSLLTDSPTYQHTTFKFLQPEHLRDAQGHATDHPHYDPRTLKIPADFLAKQTPAMKQWWILKSKYFDTVLFFKLGKFYELFHMDAVIGVNELNILYMKGDYAHCGFPEISYGRFSEVLVEKGYKVARVEQTETPDQMQERCKLGKLPGKEKVVRREVCSVQSRGTKRSSFIDGECGGSDQSKFLLAISEVENGSTSTFGVCFVDVMIGTFHVGEFEDDRHASRLRTLVSHYSPVQVLHQKGALSDKCRLMFDGCLSHVLREPLKAATEFWTPDTTIKFLADVFGAGDDSSSVADDGDGAGGKGWPEALKEFVDFEPLPSAKATATQALSALGAVVWYLKHCLMEQELLSMRSFEVYKPLDNNYALTAAGPVGAVAGSGVNEGDSQATAGDSGFVGGGGSERSSQNSAPASQRGVFSSRMVLDGVTLVNLDVLLNGSSGGLQGSLLHAIDSCKTPFGKRLFKQWLCTPLSSPSHINDRLDAIDDLTTCPDVTIHVTSLLSKLPDLEKLLNKIHSLGSSRHNKNHPDNRAVFFEDVTYSKRKIEDFIATLSGFKTLVAIVDTFHDVSAAFKSRVLKSCVSLRGRHDGRFPNIQEKLDFFEKSFDQQKARSEGVIKPVKGVNEAYDEALLQMEAVEAELDGHLQALRRRFNCKTLQYIGTGKSRFQLEMPEGVANKVDGSFELISQRKGFKRYQDEKIKSLFGRLTVVEEQRDSSQRDTMKCIFDQFDKHFKEWSQAVQCISVLDCLFSLCNYASNNHTCRPQFVQQDEPFLEIINGRHACIANVDFIPNDTVLGSVDEKNKNPRCMLLTGPNMGGKSTLMRQDGLICIIAHLGCYVPADSCRLTPIDRIFTRLGASDHIMQGESTFYVELSETSCILQHATKHSLVLLDELGRGTATYDGNAIAASVLEELVEGIGCRTIFSTHYHSIVDRFAANPNVFLAHMACMVEGEVEDDPCQETITFLFRLAPGNCPKSHGFNAAKLAGIPVKVIQEAHRKAKEFEVAVKDIELFRFLWRLKEEDARMLTSLPPLQWHSLCSAAAAAVVV